MITYLIIALGSALGGMARYGCSSLLAATVGETFPWGRRS
jgi:fluoride exporter